MNMRIICQTIFFLLFPLLVHAQTNALSIDLPTFETTPLIKYLNSKILYTHDFISNTGGAKAGPRNIGALDFYIESNLGDYSVVQGEFMAHYVHINQNDRRGAIGEVQTASNIDAPVQVDRIGDLWYQHLWSEHFKTLIGLHDISSEFNITESSLPFLNSSFGTSAELSYSGLNSPSIYPVTSLGGRVHYRMTDELSIRVALYHANPGGPEGYRSFDTDFGGRDGLMYISEIAHQNEDHKIGVGAWGYSKQQAKLGSDDLAPLFGSYANYELKLLDHLWAFFRYGWASPITNEIESNFSTGVVFHGIFQGKKIKDEAGLGFTNAHMSHRFEEAGDEAATFSSNELVCEFYYQFRLSKNLSLKPDIQFIQNPGGLGKYKNSWATGLRTSIEL